MDEYNISVGKRITETRKQRGYTREKLSELADVSTQFLADIEKGRKSMTISTLRKIAHALGVTSDYIVDGSEPVKENVHVNTMLSALTPYQRAQAERLLTVFVESLMEKEKH